MSDRFYPWRSSLKIIGTLWLPAMVLYFLEHVAFTGSLGVPYSWSRFIDPAIACVAKIVFLCWIWGLILETCSGESAVAHYAHFRFHLQQGWWIALAVMAAPWILHFAIFMITGREIISLPFIKAFLGVFTVYWAAENFFRIKYGCLVPPQPQYMPRYGTILACGIVLLMFSISLYFIKATFNPWLFIKPFGELIGIQAGFVAFAVFSYAFVDAYPEIAGRFQSARTLILVNPLGGSIRTEALSSVIVRRYPPFFTVLKALTPSVYRVVEYNRVFWREHFYRGKALVAISCFTTNSAATYNIAREFRRRGSTVVLGGPHASFFPEEALEFCDSVVIGAAESVWPELIRDYENGCLKRFYCGHCSEKESDLVYQFLLQNPAEIIKDCLQVSPGCKFNCYFCATTALTGKLRPQKTVAEIIALIRKAGSNKKPVVFIDNNIYENPDYAKDLFRALVPLNQPWAASSSIDIAQDDEAISLLKQSRCEQLLIGYEIDADSTMRDKGGKLALAKDYLRLTKKLKKAGITIQAQFIFGFPSDSWSSLVRLWWFCLRLAPTYTWVSFLTPLPGARYFEDSVRKGRILNLNWRAYDLMRQVAEAPNLRRSWILQNGFTPISLFLFFTTSFAGRLLLLVFILMEFIYYHV